MKVGVIRVLTLEDQAEVARHGNLIEEHFPEINTVSQCIEGQPNGIHDSETKDRAIPKIKELARRFQETEDIQALFVSCTEDPGVVDIRDELTIPVLGAGESLAGIASTVSESLGLLAISSQPPEPVQSTLKDAITETVRVADDTLDLGNAESNQRTVKTVQKMEQKECGAIALGCTGFSTVGMAKKLGKETNLPLIDPVVAGGSVLYNLLYSKGNLYDQD